MNMLGPFKTAPILGFGGAWRWRIDGTICLLLFMAISASSFAYLRVFDFRPSVIHGDGDMFDAAISVALGMGYSSIDSAAPSLAEFKERKAFTVDRDALNNPDFFKPADGKFDLDRIYLLYAIGLIWRIVGISWDTIFALNSLFSGLCATIVYLIFRLVARPWLSLAGTLAALISPIYIQMLPAVRDFCKAPFILATLLFCGLLLTGRVRGRALLVAASVMGVIIGIGVGFRQDSIICLPMAIACLTVFHRGTSWPWRFAAVTLMMMTFLPTSWPVFRMNAETAGNNSFYLTQGFTTQSIQALELDEASYTQVYTHSDYIVHAYICHYAKARDLTYRESASEFRAAHLVQGALLGQVMPINLNLVSAALLPVDSLEMWSYGAEMLARKCTAELYATFPADVLTRAYASVLRLTRGVNTLNNRGAPSDAWMTSFAQLRAPVMDHLYLFGPFYAVAVFLIVAAMDIWLAFGTLLLFLYFFGYPSISFQMRHAFHLSFVAFWLPAFLLEALFALKRRGWMGAKSIWPSQLAPMGRAGAFLAFVCACFLIPLWGARNYQQQQVEPLLQSYAEVELEPVETRETLDAMGKFYQPEPGQLFQLLEDENSLLSILPPLRAPDFQVEYLAADIECGAFPGAVNFEYASSESFFEGGVLYHPSPDQSTQTLRLFFPIFQFSNYFASQYESNVFPPFGQIRVPADTMRLKQLYRVKRPEDFPFLMTVWLDKDPDKWQLEHTLRYWPQ